MTTNELMRHLFTDIPVNDQRHLVEVVDRNHAEQRRASAVPRAPEDGSEPSRPPTSPGTTNWTDPSVGSCARWTGLARCLRAKSSAR